VAESTEVIGDHPDVLFCNGVRLWIHLRVRSQQVLMEQTMQNAAPLVVESSPVVSAMDVWEPPFERWMRIADDVLRDCPVLPPPNLPRRS
jgi:hypothetical protein